MGKLGSGVALLWSIGMVGALGCAVDALPLPADIEDEGDAIAVVDGKVDAAGLLEGEPRARGVLFVVNLLDVAELRADARLSARVANNIVAYRKGDDGRFGGDDDERFDSLTELDAIPFVGPRVFEALVAYAVESGLVPAVAIIPTELPVLFAIEEQYFLGSDRISGRDLVETYLYEGEQPGDLGRFDAYVRTRSCDAAGCDEWSYTHRELSSGVLRVSRPNRLEMVESAPGSTNAGGACRIANDDTHALTCTRRGAATAGWADLVGGATAFRVYLRSPVRRSAPDAAGASIETEELVLGTFGP